ncbi:hypothetical protein HPA02_34630 [Bisbaumannia pacifica]|uniref:Uncharacterized protein n=1 Tax=Bisbaumannia pacifica TaxID=77098 RepID=A0A510XGV0_9GAMM|nr:hypothetical protein HPA02_34630 [Halomonas pacifica]
MSCRYIIRHRGTPRCDLPGSPYPSRIAAKRAADQAGLAPVEIVTVKRRSA